MAVSILAIDAGTFGLVMVPVTMFIGFLIGIRLSIPKTGALLGFFGWPGWILTFAVGIALKRFRAKDLLA